MTPLEEEQSFLDEYRQYLQRTGDPVIGIADPDSDLASALREGVNLPTREKFQREPLLGSLTYYNSTDNEVEHVRIGYAFGVVKGLSVIPWESKQALLYFASEKSPLVFTGTSLEFSRRRVLDYQNQNISSVWEYLPGDSVTVFTNQQGIANKSGTAKVDQPPHEQAKTSDHLYASLLRREVINEFVPFVDTLQPDQYHIVNHDPFANFVVINGPAGSGKTGCALLRIALRHYRYATDSAKNNHNLRVLILSKTNQLLEYISNVVPSLGYDRPQTKPYAFILNEVLANVNKRTTIVNSTSELPLFRYQTINGICETRDEVISTIDDVKTLLMSETFTHHVVLGAQIQSELNYCLVPLNGNTYTIQNRSLIEEKSYIPIVDTRTWITSLWAARDVKTTGERLIGRLLNATDLNRLDRREKLELRTILLRWLTSVTKSITNLRPKDIHQWIEACKTHSPGSITSRSLRRIDWCISNCHSNLPDAYAVALLYTIIRHIDVSVTIQTSLEINDVVIDEAQNFMMSELFLIRSLFVLGSSYTLCGDLNQRLDDSCISDWLETEPLFGSYPDIFYLTRNLRNTQQINAVSLTLIGDQISDPSPVSGPPVRVITSPNNDYATLIDELRTSIDHLENPKIVVIRSKPYVDSLTLPIEVVDMDAIGGLEYDGAVIVVHDLADSANSRRSLYVALTRSRWAVTLVIEDDKSMWVKDLLGSAPPDCVTVD